jgi:protein SDA1
MQNYNKTHADKTVQKNIQLIIDLYKRNIWTDTRAVNIIAEGCLNQSPKVRLLSAHFLLDTT